MKADKENWIGEEVEAGEFVVMIKTPWRSFVDEFSFSIYGPSTSDIRQISQKEVPKDFVMQILLSHAKEHPHEFSNFA